MGRVAGSLDIVLLNEASNKEARGLGLRAGIGFSALGSTFGLVESSPFLRAGILIGNIRVTYAKNIVIPTIIDHQVTIGLKFDW